MMISSGFLVGFDLLELGLFWNSADFIFISVLVFLVYGYRRGDPSMCSVAFDLLSLFHDCIVLVIEFRCLYM